MSTRPKHGFPKRLPAFGKKSHMGGPRSLTAVPETLQDGRWSEGEFYAAGASVEALANLGHPDRRDVGLPRLSVVYPDADLILQEVLTRR
jgi:hypothetical protein